MNRSAAVRYRKSISSNGSLTLETVAAQDAGYYVETVCHKTMLNMHFTLKNFFFILSTVVQNDQKITATQQAFSAFNFKQVLDLSKNATLSSQPSRCRRKQLYFGVAAKLRK